MTAVQIIPVDEDDADLRLDRWFKRRFPLLRHGALEKMLRTGQIRVDGKRAKGNFRLLAGMEIRVPPGAQPVPGETPSTHLPPRRPAQQRVSAGEAQSLRAAVLHMDDDVMVINKPPGLAVQGGSKTKKHLDGMLDVLRFDAADRPRLVHRLDKDTSGVLVLARNVRAAASLSRAFQGRDVEKIYWALVAGLPKPQRGAIDLALEKSGGVGRERMREGGKGARRARTDFVVIAHAGREASWLALRPHTGRTHQLRAHCSAIGCPILGDGKYGGKAAFLAGVELSKQLHLHALSLELPHPRGGRLSVSAPPPRHFRNDMAILGFAPDAYDPEDLFPE